MVNPALWRTILLYAGLTFTAAFVLRILFLKRPHPRLRAFLEFLAGAQGAISLYFFAMLLASDFRSEQKPLQYAVAGLFWATWLLATLAAKFASEQYVRDSLTELQHTCPTNRDASCTTSISPVTALRLSWLTLSFFAVSLFIAVAFPSWLAARSQQPSLPKPTGPEKAAIPQPERYVQLRKEAWSFLTWAKAAGTTSYTLALQDIPLIPNYNSIIVEVTSPTFPIHLGTCQPAPGTVVNQSQQPLVIQNTSAVYRFLLPHFDGRLGWYITLQTATGSSGLASPDLPTRIGYLNFQ